MLVQTDETLTCPGPVGPLRAMAFQQRFALTVLGSFAVALVLLGVLFLRTGEVGTGTPSVTGPAAAASAVDRGAVSATAMAP